MLANSSDCATHTVWIASSRSVSHVQLHKFMNKNAHLLADSL